MLNKEELKNLLRNKEYLKIIQIFKNEYTNILLEFSKKNNITISNETEIEELIMEISEKFPNLEGYMDTLSIIFFSPDMYIGDNIDYMLSNYESIKRVLT